MKKLLVVIDMQNDFVFGALGTEQARAIVEPIRQRIEQYMAHGDEVVFTRDTHNEDYLSTQEGKYLPVPHCIDGTVGHNIIAPLQFKNCLIFDKPCFGSLELAQWAATQNVSQIELCGVCTDICVVSNALILKAHLPQTPISVNPALCAGVTPQSHQAALLTMKMCQIDVE